MSKRIVAVDFGHARIGLAVSDPQGLIASPLSTIKGSKDLHIAAHLIAEALKGASQKLSCEFASLVLGLPLHLNGTESDRSREVRQLASLLETASGMKVFLFDERLTTVLADRALRESSFSRKRRTHHVDSVASLLLLQSYLDLQSRERS